MAAKVSFDPATKSIQVTEVPSGTPPTVTLNVKVDLYSDAKEDWLVTPALQKMRFPILPLGGNEIPIGFLGESYILTDGWRILPYEADHEFIIEGNLFPDVGYELVADTVGDYRVVVTREISTLVELRTTDVSGLTAAESAALDLIRKFLTNKIITDPSTGVMTVYDDDDATPVGAGNIYEDTGATQSYRGRGIERRERLT